MPRHHRWIGLAAACIVAGTSSAAVAEAQTSAPITPASVGRRLDASLDSLAATGWLSGAVMVTRGRDTIVAGAFGHADRARGIANTLDTRFAIASAGKMFTAVAIAQLVEQGRIALTDTVGRHLPDHPNATVRAQVTIAQLLSHTSGMGSYWNARYQEQRAAIRSSADYIALTAGDALLFAPGARYEYSNAGYALLGGIVERASGLAYADYVARRILGPSGMTRTGFPVFADAPADVAVGYGAAPGGPMGPMRRDRFASAPPAAQPNGATLPGRGGAAGDAVSTVGDLTAFVRAVAAGTLTSPAMRDALWTIRARPDPATSRGQPPYGYGFVIRDDSPLGRAIGHPGGAMGRAAFVQHYPERDVTVAILANVDPLVTFEVLSRIESALAALPAR